MRIDNHLIVKGLDSYEVKTIETWRNGDNLRDFFGDREKILDEKILRGAICKTKLG